MLVIRIEAILMQLAPTKVSFNPLPRMLVIRIKSALAQVVHKLNVLIPFRGCWLFESTDRLYCAGCESESFNPLPRMLVIRMEAAMKAFEKWNQPVLIPFRGCWLFEFPTAKELTRRDIVLIPFRGCWLFEWSASGHGCNSFFGVLIPFRGCWLFESLVALSDKSNGLGFNPLPRMLVIRIKRINRRRSRPFFPF